MEKKDMIGMKIPLFSLDNIKHGAVRNKWNVVTSFFIAGVFLALFLTYLSWGLNLIPNHLGFIGHIDDAILLFIGAWIIRGDIRHILHWFKKIN